MKEKDEVRMVNGYEYRANFEFKFKKDAEIIYAVLKPEENQGIRSEAKIYLERDALLLRLKAEDLTSLRASMNTWLRLIKICEEVLENEC